MEQLLLGRKHYHILRLFSMKDSTNEGLNNGFLSSGEIIKPLSKKYGASTLYKDLFRLTELGLIKKVKHSQTGRLYYSLSERGEKIISNPSSRHTFILGKVLNELELAFPRIKSHFSPEEIACPELGLDTSYLNPDSVLKIMNSSNEIINCALELELTQKNATDIRTKYEKYVEDTYFSKCIYLFEFERDFEKYTYIFTDFVDQIRDEGIAKIANSKFLFVLNELLESPDSMIKESKTMFKNRTTDLNIFFGESKKQ